MHDTILVHRVRYTPVPDRSDHCQLAVPPAENRKRDAGARARRVHFRHLLRHVLRQAGRVPVGAHQNTPQPVGQQDVPQPVHTHAHPGYAVLRRHDYRTDTAQNEKLVLQNQQGMIYVRVCVCVLLRRRKHRILRWHGAWK